jgi:hypothetical protein
MSEPHEHNPSGFESPSPGASRFWHEYSSARSGRTSARNGEARSEERAGRADGEHECLEWCPICRGADVVRATTPPEFRQQLQSVQRDALVMMRALIDAYLERLGDGRAHAHAHRVEDIPIE